MTFEEMERIMAARKIPTVTLSISANGKAMASASFPAPRGQFVSKHRWGDSTAEALDRLFAEEKDIPDSGPVKAKPYVKPVEEIAEPIGDLVHPDDDDDLLV